MNRATGERADAAHTHTLAERYLFVRQLAAYGFAAECVNSGLSVLDVACGSGYGSARLAEHARQVIGVDCDHRVVRNATLRYGSKSCRFLTADACRLPFDDGAFDCIVSFQTIEHIRNDLGFVRELRRVLSPTGVCMVTTPNRILRLRPGQRPWNRFHVREYDQESLQKVLRTAFSSVEVRGVTATARWAAFERRRIRSAMYVARIDPLGLRHSLPENWSAAIRRVLQALIPRRSRDPDADSSTEVTLGDFQLSPLAQDSQDLFATCR
jgi:ubiquinone/menaquinone biosynthesis C-methylase UbiE